MIQLTEIGHPDEEVWDYECGRIVNPFACSPTKAARSSKKLGTYATAKKDIKADPKNLGLFNLEEHKADGITYNCIDIRLDIILVVVKPQLHPTHHNSETCIHCNSNAVCNYVTIALYMNDLWTRIIKRIRKWCLDSLNMGQGSAFRILTESCSNNSISLNDWTQALWILSCLLWTDLLVKKLTFISSRRNSPGFVCIRQIYGLEM